MGRPNWRTAAFEHPGGVGNSFLIGTLTVWIDALAGNTKIVDHSLVTGLHLFASILCGHPDRTMTRAKKVNLVQGEHICPYCVISGIESVVRDNSKRDR